MAIYTTLDPVAVTKHGLFRSSRLKATDVGRLYDVVVRDSLNKEIDVDNGVAVKIGNPVGDGLQKRYATIAGTSDKVAVIGTPAINRAAFTRLQDEEFNFYNKAGSVAKAYEVLPEQGEIFGVAEYQFTTIADTTTKKVKFGNYVIVDGNGGWKEVTTNPNATTAVNGFVGRVYGFEQGDNETIVLIECLDNAQL